MALLVHELATNSLKYGALSVPEGVLDISGSQVDDKVQIVWTEQGGPAPQSQMTPDGYGSKLVLHTVEYQLGGSVSYNWSPTGLIVILLIGNKHLAR